MAITPSQWAAEGALPGLNRQREFGSKMMTEELNRQETTANIYSKLLETEEKRYDFDEKKTPVQRTKRDTQAIAETKKAENAGYRFGTDTEDRQMMQVANLAKVAQETGSDEAWEQAISGMGKLHPVYGKMLKDEQDPHKRRQIVNSIGAGISRSLEVAQKGQVIGMEGKAARQLQKDKAADNMELQENKFESMVEMAQEAREFKADEGQAQRTHEREIAAGRHAVTDMIRQWAKQSGQWDAANDMLAAYIEAETDKTRRTGLTGGEHPSKTAARQVEMSEKIMKQVVRRATSSASGTGVDIDDPAELNEIPGGKDMGAYVDTLVGKNLGQQAARMTGERFAYVNEDIGFVRMPERDGQIVGGVTAMQLEKYSRARGRTMEFMLRRHKATLLEDGLIQQDEWNW